MDHRLFFAQDYALINPMQVAVDQRADLETTKLLPKGLQRHARMMPLLLDLGSLPDAMRMDLLERAEQWGRDHDMPLFSALLVGKVDTPRLERHLLRNVLLSRPGAGGTWLRFHDPRVFRHLRWLLDGHQMCRLMGPVKTWTWYEPLGATWHSCERPGAMDFRRLQPTSGQWAALDEFEALNRCMRDVALETGAPPEDSAAKLLLDGLMEARALGLRDVADRSFYALKRMSEGLVLPANSDIGCRAGLRRNV